MAGLLACTERIGVRLSVAPPMKVKVAVAVLALALCLSCYAETREEQNAALDQFTEYAFVHRLEFYIGRDSEGAPWTARLSDGKTDWSDTERTATDAVKSVEEKYEKSLTKK